MSSEQVAQALLEIGAVGFSLETPIRFKSGILSPVYVDNRRLPFHPAAWRVALDAFQSLIRSASIHFDVIAGVAMGGVPHGAALACLLNVPFVFVRKEAKEHGKRQQVEGGTIDGLRVLVIEDLITTGSSSLSAVDALRESGARVQDVLAIVSYSFIEAQTAFHHAELNLHTATTFPVILDTALEKLMLSDTEAEAVREWLADPYNWASKRGLA